MVLFQSYYDDGDTLTDHFFYTLYEYFSGLFIWKVHMMTAMWRHLEYLFGMSYNLKVHMMMEMWWHLEYLFGRFYYSKNI